MEFKDDHARYPRGITGVLPTGTDDSTAVGGGSVRHEFNSPNPINVIRLLLGVTVAGAGAGVGTGTMLTTVVNSIKIYKGSKTNVTKKDLVCDFAQGTFFAVHRMSILRSLANGGQGICGAIVDPAIAANGTLYGASMAIAIQLPPGTYTVEVTFNASSATSYPTFATPPTSVAYNVAAVTAYISDIVTSSETWTSNQLTIGGLSVDAVREVYVERGAAIATTLNRMDFDISINAYGAQAASVYQAAILLASTGACFPFYRSSGDYLPHSFSVSFTGAAAAITVVAIR